MSAACSGRLVLMLAALAATALIVCAPALAQEDAWSGTEQPVPPGASWQVGLGKVGDIEFEAPDRGLLITEGKPPSVPAGLWAYNGVEWHEYATVCGASEKTPEDGGRIAWAGPSEFWTVSDGRAGQGNESAGTSAYEKEPPLEDNTLCHFSGGQLVGSYAHPAFQADSYQLMHGAACLSSSDCWFAGEALPSPQVGAFQLHWNGSTLEAAPYLGETSPVQDMLVQGEQIFQSALLDGSEATEPPAVRVAEAGGSFQAEESKIPLYTGGEPPEALDFLHLAAGGSTLWAAAGPRPLPSGSSDTPGQVTVVTRRRGIWSQLIGPGEPLTGTPANPLAPIFPGEAAREKALLGATEGEVAGGEAKTADVTAIAAEPGSEDAWIALAPPGAATPSDRRAVLVKVNREGEEVGEPVILPTDAEEGEGIGPKGTAARLTCPGEGDCWMVTSEGWLFHLAPRGERTPGRDPAEGEFFHGVITYRPPDQGLPQVTPDAPPADTSGEVEEGRVYEEFKEQKKPQAMVTLPLISGMHSRLVHGSTLELRFHLSVKARVGLIARRKSAIVAQTPLRTYKAGNRSLTLRLDPHRWPTSLKLKTHALAPLRKVPSSGSGSSVVTTGETVLVGSPLRSWIEPQLP